MVAIENKQHQEMECCVCHYQVFLRTGKSFSYVVAEETFFNTKTCSKGNGYCTSNKRLELSQLSDKVCMHCVVELQ